MEKSFPRAQGDVFKCNVLSDQQSESQYSFYSDIKNREKQQILTLEMSKKT